MVSCPATSSVIISSRSSIARHRLAILVTGAEQHREDVAALLQPGVVAALADLARTAARRRARSSRRTTPSRSNRRVPSSAIRPAWSPGSVEAAQHLAQAGRASASRRGPSSRPKTAWRMTSSVIACMRGHSVHRLAGGPAIDLALGYLPHPAPRRPPSGAPWKGGSISLRWVMCAEPSSVSTELCPTQRAENGVALAGAEHVRVAREHLLDHVRVADHDPGALLGQLHGPHVAGLGLGALEEGHRADSPAQRLERHRHPRAGWQRGGGGRSSHFLASGWGAAPLRLASMSAS